MNASAPPRRLDPCPCGSGKRYKDCHGVLRVDPRLSTAAALRRSGDLGGALAFLTALVTAEPTLAAAWDERGMVHADLLQVEAAKLDFRRAIEAAPPFPEAHFHLALLYLLERDYARGWAEYEWRTRVPGYADYANFAFGMPRWRGEPLEGKRILVHAEQGLGDTIQFARFLAPLARRAREVEVFCQPSLESLIGRMPGVRRAFSTLAQRPDHDYHSPILDAGARFLTHEGADHLAKPYVAPLPQRSAVWAGRLEAVSHPRIGFVWKGSARHANDHNRSLSREQAEQLARALPNRVDLQLGEAPLAAAPAFEAAAHIADWEDTCAALAHVDVVVTVDTSVAHLAGAMGKSTWVLLPFSPDWRWGLGSESTPWYEGMRLLRQGADRGWPSVLDRVAFDAAALP